MAEVQSYTTDAVDALVAGAVVSANLNTSTGELTLTTHDGTVIHVGSIVTGIADATTSVKGVVELATDTETIVGTDTVRAVTPFGLAAVVASTNGRGLVELATNTEAVAGTDIFRAVTPAGLAAVTAAQNTANNTAFQPKDSDLTTIAAIAQTGSDFLQANAGVWTNRTPYQASVSLSGVGVAISYYSTGSGYSLVNGPGLYVGPTDPGSVANGSIWLDTTGT